MVSTGVLGIGQYFCWLKSNTNISSLSISGRRLPLSTV